MEDIFKKITKKHILEFQKLMLEIKVDSKGNRDFTKIDKFIDNLIEELNFKENRVLLVTYLNNILLEGIVSSINIIREFK